MCTIIQIIALFFP